MAKKEKQEKPIEVSLWESANKLRGSVEPSEYKHVVLGLIFLKFVSDKFEEHRVKLIAEGKEKYVEIPEFYNISNRVLIYLFLYTHARMCAYAKTT
jgi:type I restriction enzyme M protein